MSWLNPWLLPLLALALVPLLLHLLLGERVQRVAFGALRFLRGQNQPALMHKRWLEWLLTALRVACVVVLVLAFARPLIGGPAAKTEPQAGKRRDLVILLDCSRSMSVGDRLDEAKRIANELVRQAAPTDAITLIAFADAEHLAVTTALDRAAATAAIAKVAATGGTTDTFAALDRAFASLHGEGGVIHLISDLQANAMARERDPGKPPAGCAVRIHQVGKPNAGDQGAVTITLGTFPADLTPGERNLLLPVRIGNRGPERTVTLRLLVNGAEREKRQVLVSAQGEAVTTLAATLTAVGESVGEVVAADVPTVFADDNRCHFVVRVVDQFNVAVVNGHPDTDPKHDAAFFLLPALTAGRSPFAARASAALPDLAGVDVVALASVDRLPEADRTRLADFVRHGGGLLISTGPDLDIKAFNQSLGELTPARLRGWSAGNRSLLPAGIDHPLLTRLAEQKLDLGTARIDGASDLMDSQAAQVVLRFDDQRPALLAVAYGKGKVLLFASTFDRRTGDLPLRPYFLPFLRETLRQLCERTDTLRQLATGGNVTVPAGGVLKCPDGSQRQAPASEPLACAIDAAGIYRLVAGQTTTTFAANADRRESDLTAADPRDLERLLAPEPAARLRVTSAGLERLLASDARLDAERRLSLGRWLLASLLVLTSAELLLARYVSRK
jgi:hypothetical protein